MSAAPVSWAVLIVGGGPTGLMLALELGRAGVRCLLVERRASIDERPKAQLANIRTMEHFRRLGLADELRARAPLPTDFPYDVVFAERLLGREITRFSSGGVEALRSVPLFSEPPQRVPQYVIEELLREQIDGLSTVECRYGSQLVDYTQTRAGVVARITDSRTDRTTDVEVDWLIGCDGAHSRVRDIADIALSGSPADEKQLGIYFEAPTLWSLHDKGRAIMYWLLDPRWPGLLGPVDTESRWWYQLVGLSPSADVDALDLSAVLHAVVGAPFPHRITRVQQWDAPSLIAARYRDRRVFLAGDAAHQHPPTGGYGMNAGIGDAVDLGWKLAAVLNGWGGPTLLASYERERRPVAERILAEANRNATAMSGTMRSTQENRRSPAADDVRTASGREFKSIGMQLGYRYDKSPVIESDGTEAPPLEVSRYVPSACPGSRLPHAWLPDGTSLFDHLSSGFTLLSVGREDHDWRSILRAAESTGVPMGLVRHESPTLRRLLDADLILVRPDQHVAWRGDGPPPRPAELLARVSGACS